MSERRSWKAEEKLAIIREIEDGSKVVETCRKHNVDPAMYYQWKKNFEAFGIDGLRRAKRMENGVRKLVIENEKLRKIIADRDIAIEMLQEALKKRRLAK